MQKPIIPITLAYLVGLLLGRGFLYFPLTVSAVAAIALSVAALLAAFRRIPLRSFLLTSLPCLVGMAAYVSSAAYFPPDHYTRAVTFSEKRHAITGTIVSPLDRDPGRTAFVLATETIDGAAARGRLRVSVRDDELPLGYGDVVSVTGRIYGPRGFRNPGGFDYPAYLASQGIHATVSVKDGGGIRILRRGAGLFRTIQDWRERIRRAFLASTTGPGSAVLQAMSLGEEGGLTDEIRDRFMAAGVTHILSISGSHLGLVALLCFGLIRWSTFLLPERLYHRLTLFADPKKIAAWLTVPPVTFYALLAGGQTATIRSLVMILFALAAVVLDRENELLHSLAAAALVILAADPQALFDISFQLSYLSVLTIGFVVSLWNGLRIPAQGIMPKLRNSASLLLIISLSTGVSTGPLVAHYFNQVSLAGVVSNMIIVPLAGFIVVPLGLLSGILSLVTGSLPLAALNQSAADGFYTLVRFFSRIPLAQFHPPAPGLLGLLLYGLFLLSGARVLQARLLSSRRPLEYSTGVPKRHLVTMMVSGATVLILIAVSLLPGTATQVTFVDVGQGDCALLELPGGKTILIDGGGTHDNRFDIGRRVVAPLLWNKRVRKLDLVVLSHPHPDHLNGLLFILRNFRVGEVWDHGLDRDLPAYAELTHLLHEKGVLLRQVSAKQPPVTIGAAALTVLHPEPGFVLRTGKPYQTENDHSLMVRVSVDGVRLLFPGDIQKDAELLLVRRGQDLAADLLKVPHHGSAGSSAEAFIAAVAPSVAVISVGTGNPYRHPSAATRARYEQRGVRVYRTDRDGAISVVIERGRMLATPWASCVLRRIALPDVRTWDDGERENWKRAAQRLFVGR